MIKVVIKKSDKLNCGYSGFVSFDYNKNIVQVMRDLPMRYYHSDKKCWEIPINKIETVKSKLSNFTVLIEDFEKILQKTEDKIKIPVSYKFKTKPYQHQIDAVEFGLNHDKWFLGDQMGSGKSKQAIDLACIKKMLNNYAHCLIICGVNTLKWNWVNEIHTHCDEQCWILGQKTLKNGKVNIGSSKAKLNDLQNIDSLPYFIITNIESFRDKDIVECSKQLCKNGKINMIVFDECHKCFDYDTEIITDLGNLKIGDIVSNKINTNVLSYNTDTKIFEYKKIIDWHTNEIFSDMIELTFDNNGIEFTIKCTPDHLFFTENREWVKAKDLTEDDILVYHI